MGTTDDFVSAVRSMRGIAPCIAAALREAVRGRHWVRAQLAVVAVAYHPSPELVEVLTELLDSQIALPDKWDVTLNIDDLADVLGLLKDERAIPSLVRCLWWNPSWDEYGSFAKKSLLSIDEIGGPAANEAIRGAVRHPIEAIRQLATDMLRARGLDVLPGDG